MSRANMHKKLVIALGVTLAGLLPLDEALARKVELVHAFGRGTDGVTPYAGVIADEAGNLIGTTSRGGKWNGGTVFKFAPDGSETLLHSFRGGNDGSQPFGGVIEDKSGNLYGTTFSGGPADMGTVFKISPDGTETQLHAFTGTDGDGPHGQLIFDRAGTLYGTTYTGGGATHCGTVFKISADGIMTTLYSFQGSEGCTPDAGLHFDKIGNLYGTTAAGGSSGWGTVFKLTPAGVESVLHSFPGSAGHTPSSSLIADKAGNLYGTTVAGAEGIQGSVFKLAPDGTFTELYDFVGNEKDGNSPVAGLLRDNAGNLYGTTMLGGRYKCGDTEGCGTVFKIAPDGSETVMHFFNNSDGGHPSGQLLMGQSGELYGTTDSGGPYGGGTIFRIKK